MLAGIKDSRLTTKLPSSIPSRAKQPETAVGGDLRRRGQGHPTVSAIYAVRPRPGGQAAAVARKMTVGNEAGPSKSPLGALGGRLPCSRVPSSSSSRKTRICAIGDSGTQSNRYYIGIEVEFQLRRLDERPPANFYEHFTPAGVRLETVKEFLDSMIALHKSSTVYPGARMALEKLKKEWWPGDWTIAVEPEVMQNIRLWEPNKFWGIEMRSPKFWASPDSNWISQVKQTWSFLQNNYEISKSFCCSTHVHISIESGFESRRTSLQNLKRIAQCAIHFEAALEACVPEERQGNRHAKSNWIDNRNFAEEKLTRRRAIDMIEKCKGEDELIDLMCPGDRNFAWNFQAMRKHGTVEFRKGAASLEGDQAVAWAQLVLLFVQAAVQVPRSSWEKIPANIRGLKAFLGLDAYGLLDPVLKGMDGENSLQPEIVMECANRAQMQMLERKLDADMLEQARLTRGQQA